MNEREREHRVFPGRNSRVVSSQVLVLARWRYASLFPAARNQPTWSLLFFRARNITWHNVLHLSCDSFVLSACPSVRPSLGLSLSLFLSLFQCHCCSLLDSPVDQQIAAIRHLYSSTSFFRTCKPILPPFFSSSSIFFVGNVFKLGLIIIISSSSSIA